MPQIIRLQAQDAGLSGESAAHGFPLFADRFAVRLTEGRALIASSSGQFAYIVEGRRLGLHFRRATENEASALGPVHAGYAI